MDGTGTDIISSDFPDEKLAIFAFIVDGEVAGTISFNEKETNPIAHRHIAALRSDPKVVECSDVDGVRFGWAYDGKQFIKPENI